MEVTKFPLGLIGCFFATLQDPHPANVKLIIVEKGEQRIIRLEKDGSRTPLVLNVTIPLYYYNVNG